MFTIPQFTQFASVKKKAFSPRALPNLTAWYKYNTGLTTEVITEQSYVTTWADQSGNGNDITQSNSSSKPILSNGLPNNLNAMTQYLNTLVFDGSADHLKASAFTLNQPFTVYIKMRTRSETNGRYVFDGHTATSTAVIQNGTGVLQIYSGSNGSGPTPNITAWKSYCFLFNNTASVYQMYPNAGTTVTTGTNNAGGFTLGAAGGGTVPGHIEVVEVLIYTGAHTAANRANVLSYLNNVGPRATNVYLAHGDSLTRGYDDYFNSYSRKLALLVSPNLCEIINGGVNSATITTLNLEVVAKIDIFNVDEWNNVIVGAWMGTNDLAVDEETGTDTHTAYQSYCEARRAAGAKVLAFTIIARNGINETDRTDFNTLVRANWTTYADGLVDVAADVRLSNHANTTYFNADGIHLKAAGNEVVANLVYSQLLTLLT